MYLLTHALNSILVWLTTVGKKVLNLYLDNEFGD